MATATVDDPSEFVQSTKWAIGTEASFISPLFDIHLGLSFVRARVGIVSLGVIVAPRNRSLLGGMYHLAKGKT